MLITSASDNNWTSTLKYKDPVSTLGLIEFSTAVDAEVDYTDDNKALQSIMFLDISSCFL